MKTLNMCDFCSREIETCGANTALADAIRLENAPLEQKQAVVACDKYQSPVDVLKKQFH